MKEGKEGERAREKKKNKQGKHKRSKELRTSTQLQLCKLERKSEFSIQICT